MSFARGGLLAAVVVAAVVVQVAVLRFLSIDGVVPNLALVIVVAAALARGPQFAAVLGFFAGLLVDVAPPADHVAGRWALALVVVGYLAGRVRGDARSSVVAAMVTVGSCSFVATSIYALSGMVMGDGTLSVGSMVEVIAVGVVWDVVVASFAIPPLLRLFDRIRPERLAT